MIGNSSGESSPRYFCSGWNFCLPTFSKSRKKLKTLFHPLNSQNPGYRIPVRVIFLARNYFFMCCFRKIIYFVIEWFVCVFLFWLIHDLCQAIGQLYGCLFTRMWFKMNLKTYVQRFWCIPKAYPWIAKNIPGALSGQQTASWISMLPDMIFIEFNYVA